MRKKTTKSMNYKNTRNFLIMKIDLSSVAGVKALADGASFVKQLNSAKRGFNGRKPSKPSNIMKALLL